jgi:hypothetical protein
VLSSCSSLLALSSEEEYRGLLTTLAMSMSKPSPPLHVAGSFFPSSNLLAQDEIRGHYLNAIEKEIFQMVKLDTNADVLKQIQAYLIAYAAVSVSQEHSGGAKVADLHNAIEKRVKSLAKNYNETFVEWVSKVAHIEEEDTRVPEYLRHTERFSVLLRKSLGG